MMTTCWSFCTKDNLNMEINMLGFFLCKRRLKYESEYVKVFCTKDDSNMKMDILKFFVQKTSQIWKWFCWSFLYKTQIWKWIYWSFLYTRPLKSENTTDDWNMKTEEKYFNTKYIVVNLSFSAFYLKKFSGY